jgi:hemolysin activation/secretion protein
MVNGRGRSSTALAVAVLSLWAILGLCALAAAQDFDLIGPKPPPPAPPGEITPPPVAKTPGKAELNLVIVPSLAGLVLIDRIDKLQRAGVHATGLAFDKLPLLDAREPRAKLAAFLGKPLTFGGLKQITDIVLAWYRAHDRPFVEVRFPEQDVSSGVVQGVVTEFHVGKIKVEGNKWFSSETIRDALRLQHGDPIDSARLADDLDRLNRNPFRHTDAVMEKSDEIGASDIDLKTSDEFPLRVYAGFDNTGTQATGRDRWSVGFNTATTFLRDQLLSYQFTSSSDFWQTTSASGTHGPSFIAHAATYELPLPWWRDSLQLFGSYAVERPQLGPDFGQTGMNGQASLRYIHPLPHPEWLQHQIEGGYDFKFANNNLAFGGNLVFADATEIDQLLLVYAATATDRFGVTTLENDLVYSPGGLMPLDSDRTFSADVAFAKANYAYDRVMLTRLTQLPWNMSWAMRATGQLSDRNLLPSEELGAGGVDSVRGYDERIANGADGIELSQELRSPPFSLSYQIAGERWGDEAQLLGFWDMAWVGDKKRQPGEPHDMFLQGAGVGVRFAFGRYLSARCDYGWQLAKLHNEPALGQLAHIAVTLAY